MPKGNRTKRAEPPSRPDPLLPPGYVRRETAIQQSGAPQLLAGLANGERRAVLYLHHGPSPFCIPIPQNYWLSAAGQISLSWGGTTDQPIQFELVALFAAIDAEAKRRFPDDAPSRNRLVAEYRTRIAQTPRVKPPGPPVGTVITLSTRIDPIWPKERAGCATLSGFVLIEETASIEAKAPATPPLAVPVKGARAYNWPEIEDVMGGLLKEASFTRYMQAAIALQARCKQLGIRCPQGSPQQPDLTVKTKEKNWAGKNGAQYIIEMLQLNDAEKWPELAATVKPHYRRRNKAR